MVTRVLITTALETTWPCAHEPLLFLGEWCRLFDRKNLLNNRDILVANYHWDDRTKLHQDYLFLQSLHEEALALLTEELNTLHNVNHSNRYWRILVGPWLGYFTQMLFDRWFMLQACTTNHDISSVRIIKRKAEDNVPNDMNAFKDMFRGDSWNEMIYGQIIEEMGDLQIDWIKPPKPIEANSIHRAINHSKRAIRDVSSFLLNQLSGLGLSQEQHFFISTYLSNYLSLALPIRLAQVPRKWISPKLFKAKFDNSRRNWRLHFNESHFKSFNSEFISLLELMIPRHIPTIYLEGYSQLVKMTDHLPWPNNPKTIFDSNSYNSNDVFKAWAAERIDSSPTRLLIGQHGGNYGIARWNFTEDHMIAISDLFLTWGWTDSKEKNIIPTGNFKLYGQKFKSNPNGRALLVQLTLPRYSYHMYSIPVSAGQWNSYFDDQCRFIKALPFSLQKQILVRLSPIDFKHSQKQRWKSSFPHISLDPAKSALSNLLKNTRLFISTYNATTYLESLYFNIPTLIFWNPLHSEMREEAKSYFDFLRQVGIYHETPESAANQMTEIWDDLDTWWNSQNVQCARHAFLDHYSKSSPDLLESLARVILR